MKKILALLLAMTMVIGLVACGNTEKPDSNTDKPGTEAVTPDTQPTPEKPEETPTETPDQGGDTTETPTETPTENPDQGGETTETPDVTIANILLEDFKAKVGTMTSEELANALVTNEAIQFMGGAVPVEPGYLAGFDADITGFKSATMFAPMIGTIPFVGYIFDMEDGADVAAFEQTLKDNANLRWNICTAADEMIVQSVDNTVFFIMAPYSMESEAPVDDGMALTDEPVEGEVPTNGETEVTETTETETTETETIETVDTTEPAEGETTETPVEGDVNTTGGENAADPAA